MEKNYVQVTKESLAQELWPIGPGHVHIVVIKMKKLRSLKQCAMIVLKKLIDVRRVEKGRFELKNY